MIKADRFLAHSHTIRSEFLFLSRCVSPKKRDNFRYAYHIPKNIKHVREIDEAIYIIHGIATKLRIEIHLRSLKQKLYVAATRLLQFFLRNDVPESFIT